MTLWPRPRQLYSFRGPALQILHLQRPTKNPSRIHSTCQLLGDGDCALAIDGDGKPVGVDDLFIIEHHDLGVAKPL